VSLTEALQAGAPQAFGALYDEYAGALYAYCQVMVGGEAGDALRDAFITVARHPGAAPGDDAELQVWLHSLTRAECVRRGALVRSVVTTKSTDPLRRALALLSPEHREVLALSNALDPEETAQVLGVARDTAETLVREAQRRLEQAAASVGSRKTQDSAMLASLSQEALHRLVTLGYEPPIGQREWVLSSCAAAGRAPDGAAGFDAGGTPFPLDAFSAQADDATHQFPKISPDESATAPLRQVDGISAGARPDQSWPDESWPAESSFLESAFAESAFPEPGLAGAAPAGLGSVGWESVGAGLAEGPNANTGEQPPLARGTHAKRRKPFLSRWLLPVVGLLCVAAATGAALAWPGSHLANGTSTLVRQSVRPSRSAQPTPSGGQTSPPPQAATSNPGVSPTPTGTAAAPTAAAPPSSTAPADGSGSAAPTPPTEPTPTAQPTPPTEPTPTAQPTPPTTPPGPPTTRPKPDHTAAPGDAPADGHRTIGRRGPGWACRGIPGRASRCAWPRPWRPWAPSVVSPPWVRPRW
jgi:DNA-directed RNA polymerase specialized sigma24 family protein